jgi:hypothetical protein
MLEKNKRLYFFALFALVFYYVGASCVESFANYPAWRHIGASEFPAYYGALKLQIMTIMVLPGVVEIGLTVVLFWLRPTVIPRWPVALVLALNMARFALTAAGQLRFVRQFGPEGIPTEALETMIRTDYLAQAISITRAVVYLWMMYRVVQSIDQNIPRREP